MKTVSIALLVAVSGVGCAHSIQYKLTSADRWSGVIIEKTVVVKTFKDDTVPPAQAETHEGAYTWRHNVRDGYKDKEIAHGVTAMIAQHLSYSGLFKQVRFEEDEDRADLVLTGTITEYSVSARVNKGAETTMNASAGFGAIGALLAAAVTAREQTEIICDVKLLYLELRDRLSGQIVWQDAIEVRRDFSAYFTQAAQGVLYRHADDCLKEVVAEMIGRISQAQVTGAITRSETTTARQPSPGPSARASPNGWRGKNLERTSK